MMPHGLKNKLTVFAAILMLLMLTQALAPIIPTMSAPEELPINKYGWFDEVVFFTVSDPAKAVEMLEKGDMDI
ncbi:hypothetical protein KEJ17_01435, partial [Candidatus Bathyarchaeota archaeon]|nr:hypothetical protein [Candidatus Bathyarchaeota archaeon]